MSVNSLSPFKMYWMKGMQTCDAVIEIGAHYGPLITSKLDVNEVLYKNAGIVVYNIHVPDYLHLVKDLIVFLEAFEKEKALKYYKETDKNRFIICRSLLKFALAYHTQSNVYDISIKLLPNKKPYLPTHPNVFFNISHSGEYAVLAISTLPIGIDIEYLDYNYNTQDTLSHIFNENEIHFINNADCKIKAFFNLWTRKEAFVKALGKGIDDDFIKIPCLNGLHRLDKSLVENSKNWFAIDFQLEANYEGSMVFATESSGQENILALEFPREITNLLMIYNNK